MFRHRWFHDRSSTLCPTVHRPTPLIAPRARQRDMELFCGVSRIKTWFTLGWLSPFPQSVTIHSNIQDTVNTVASCDDWIPTPIFTYSRTVILNKQLRTLPRWKQYFARAGDPRRYCHPGFINRAAICILNIGGGRLIAAPGSQQFFEIYIHLHLRGYGQPCSQIIFLNYKYFYLHYDLSIFSY